MTAIDAGRTGPSLPPATAPTIPLYSPPSAAEQDALRRAASYLRRAGNEVGGRALLPDLALGPGWAAGRDGPGGAKGGFAALHDSLRAAASLCEGMAAGADDGDGTIGARAGAPPPSGKGAR